MDGIEVVNTGITSLDKRDERRNTGLRAGVRSKGQLMLLCNVGSDLIFLGIDSIDDIAQSILGVDVL